MKIKVKDVVFRYKSDPVLKNVCLHLLIVSGADIGKEIIEIQSD